MQIKKHSILTLLFLGAVITSIFFVVRYPQFFFGKGRATTTAVGFPAQDIVVSVEVARDPYAWSRGLMFREALPEQSGMLFVFPDSALRSFWMKNVLISLDIIFISQDRRVVAIHRAVPPCVTLRCPTYGSITPAMYVLEVGAGFADRNGIKEGDVVEINNQ